MQRHQTGRVMLRVPGVCQAGVVPSVGSQLYLYQTASGLEKSARKELEYLEALLNQGKSVESLVAITTIPLSTPIQKSLVKTLRAMPKEVGIALGQTVRICRGECGQCGNNPMVVRGRNLFAIVNALPSLCAVLQESINKETAADPQFLSFTPKE